MAYEKDVAEVYDLIYAQAVGKDYAAEARELAALIRDRRPDAASLLDVACGTGQHLLHFQELFTEVAGVELAPDMRAVAAQRLPDIAVHAGDMRTFRLDRTFSALTCLFSSIGYVQSADELEQACEKFSAHLEPGGVLIVEPWFSPEEWIAGSVHHEFAEAAGRSGARMSYLDVAGTKSLTTMHYLYGEVGRGVRHWTDEHLMSLFTHDEYLQTLATTGFVDAAWLPGWREDRDRIIATRA